MPGNANPLNNPGAEHRSANATTKLEGLGFTIEDTQEFIEDNMDDLDFIHEVCLAYGLTTDDIAVIMDIEDYDGQVISDYFAQFGIDASDLDSNDDSDDDSDEIDDASDDEIIGIVEDGLYSGTISSDFFEFEGIFETKVTDDEITGNWSIEIDDIVLYGNLSGEINSEDGTYSLYDDNFNLTITGTITDENSVGIWISGSFSGNVEAIFIA